MVQETGIEAVEKHRTDDAADARVAFITRHDGYVVKLVEDIG